MSQNMRVAAIILIVGCMMGCQQSKKQAENASEPFGPVASDLNQRLARWQQVKMPFDSSGLSERQKQLIEKLVDASRDLDNIYWRQSDPQALEIYKKLEGSTNPRDVALRRMLMINGSRFDLLDDNKPFVGTAPMPPGHALYAEGLTHQEIDAYIKQHPSEQGALYSHYTIVERHGSELAAVTYHEAYKQFLAPAAANLRAAANLSDDKDFAKFLNMRAAALLNDDYYASDLAWLELKNPKIDLIFAPYETYLDGLLGVKGSYGAAVLIRNEAESKNLALYEKYIPEIQEALPLPAQDLPSTRGHLTPMEVVDSPFRGGDLRHGYQAVADNLPNDPRIHKEKGTKKIFFKNFMDARVNNVIIPLARRIMQPDQAAKVTGEGSMAMVVMHEISHGLGPVYSRVGNKHVDIREAIGPTFSGLEEAKADVVGMYGLKWLVDHNALPQSRLEEYYASYVGGIFRTVRYGVGEAHGQAEIMEFNYLSEQRAITRDSKTGRYVIDYLRMPGAIAKLAKELLQIEATGDRARAEAWFKRYDVVPPELQSELDKAQDLPVDVDPVFSFTDQPE